MSEYKSYLFEDPQREIQRVLEMARRRENRSAITPNSRTAALVAANRRAYPWLNPGTSLALSKAGHGPDSPATRRAAAAGARVRSRRGGGIGGWLGDRVEDLGDALDWANDHAVKPAARAAFTALEAGTETVDAIARDFARTVEEEGVVKGLLFGGSLERVATEQPSTLAVAADQFVSGDSVDLGSGFFPSGETKQRQEQAARSVHQVDGHVGTVGRIFARTVTEPGTKPYNTMSGLLDAAKSIYGDPAAGALSAAAKTRQAAKTFTVVEPSMAQRAMAATGLVHGPRKQTMDEVVDAWLESDEARGVLDFLANEGDFYRIWNETGRKLDVRLANQLSEAKTADEVKQILRPELGVSVREKPRVGGLGVAISRNLQGVRLAQSIPGNKVDLNDVNQAVEQMDRFLKNAKVDPDTIAKYTKQIAAAESKTEMYDAFAGAMSDVKGVLASAGIDGRSAKRMTTMWQDYHQELRQYFVDEIGQQVQVPGAVIDGGRVDLPSPHLYVELIDGAIPLPDFREIRRATSEFSTLLNHPAVRVPDVMLTAAMDKVLKPLWLATRVAWPVRVIGEEQIRMAAAGLDSFIRHPLSWLAWATGAKGRADDVFGESFKDAASRGSAMTDFAKAMNRGAAGWADTGFIRTKHYTTYARGHEQYARSWAEELLQLREDPIATRTVGGWSPGDRVPGGLSGNDAADAKRWFWEGPGKKLRLEMAHAHPGLLDEETAGRYVDSVVDRIRIKTGDDPELVAAISRGEVAGVAIRDGDRVNKAFVNLLDGFATAGRGPERVKGQLVVSVADKALGHYDRAVTAAFSALYSKPTNYLSRSPAFRQFYWKRLEEMLPFLDEAGRREAVRKLKELGVDDVGLKGTARRLLGVEKQAADLPHGGTLTLADADAYAKGWALEETKGLLYDLTEKSQWADAGRLVAPFAEAWKEILTTWAKLATNNPAVVRRFQQTVQGARGAGFFYEDPQTGEEMFVYPGSEFITDKVLGVPIPLTGHLSGLNIVGETPLMPGLGPVVQIPASALIPDAPQWDWVRDAVLPFGDPDFKNGILEQFLPGWVKKAWTAKMHDPNVDRDLGNATFDMARVLASSGKYDTSTPEGLGELLDDAASKARLVYALRALGQFALPTPPEPEWIAYDRDGQIVTAFKLVEEFRKLQEKDYDTAVERFHQMFGDDAFLFMQGKSTGGFAATESLHNWVRENRGLVESYGRTYGFFAPKAPEDDEFSFEEYDRQLARGEREPLSPREAIELANHRVASMLYRTAKRKVGTRRDAVAAAWLADIRATLLDEYPGYNPDGVRVDQLQPTINELERAAEDPALADTDAGRGLVLYLRARKKATAAAQELGLKGFGSAKRARHIRDWLRQIADAIVAEHAAFAEMYDRVFSREMVDDDAVGLSHS